MTIKISPIGFKSAFAVLILICLGIAAAGCMSQKMSPIPEDKELPYDKAVFRGWVTDKEIVEASGMASSQIHDGILWLINDSGNKPVIYGVTFQGELKAKFTISCTDDGKYRDWEDLASFNWKGKPCLIIADVGDNNSHRNPGRDIYFLHVIEEPDIQQFNSINPKPIAPLMTISFRYSDGSHNCEAVGVDSLQKKIFLISKDTEIPMLYELPLPDYETIDTCIARPVAGIKTLPSPGIQDLIYKYAGVWSKPTAMDLTQDGEIMIILTYKNAYLYRLKPYDSWSEAFSQMPETIALPHPGIGRMLIRECLAIHSKTGEIFVTSERNKNAITGRRTNPEPIYSVKISSLNQ